jgi:polysaccharide deacetylase family protein (PEP-CTERM system associated)
MTVINALTVDVEDYFHVHAFSDVICLEDWDACEPAVERNTYSLLDLLDSVKGPNVSSAEIHQDDRDHENTYRTLPAAGCLLPAEPCTRATFFVLGWVAERYPNLVREIDARGHEVACHGYGHQCVFNQGKREFKEDVTKAKGILEDITGNQVIGYRAPTCSITRDTIWALEIIFEMGFRYDSSIFPIKHDFYGFPKAPRFPFYIDFTNGDLLSQFQNPKYLHMIGDKREFNQDESPGPTPYTLCPMPASGLVEFPLSTISVLGQKLPCSGGGYFRLFPYWYTRRGFKKLNNNGTHPVIFYIHPWELDPEIPIVDKASRRSKFRTYVNLNRTESRFKRLLKEFHFAPLASILNAHR